VRGVAVVITGAVTVFTRAVSLVMVTMWPMPDLSALASLSHVTMRRLFG
jgi:hypothetical protein